MLIHCSKLPFSLLPPHSYSDIEILTTYCIPYHFEKDENDCGENVEQTSCFDILQDLLFVANTYHQSDLILVNTYHQSHRKTDLNHISIQISKIMEQSRVIREPYNKGS